MDPYAVLGVPRSATPLDIRKAYLKKAKLLHPDTNSERNAHSSFQRLQEAYQILSDRGVVSSSSSSSFSPGATAASTWQQRRPTPDGPFGFHGWHPGSHTKYGAFRAAQEACHAVYMSVRMQEPPLELRVFHNTDGHAYVRDESG
eukprot:CAMPEP_0115260990 /NCGR_PEP_ID=MMETSP0270-20121206/48626_1 /TAXON_ID=71861 /ORGANISM="Scrippsiella trochoidea, Strain CCMP3099" /LENGTH=144 /DNA_ID=CAMNT_0002676851 /DNA_START=42 /DNA_END=472 /DNA_ORIENTATION=+